jgi:type I restriction enzyme S subunit
MKHRAYPAYKPSGMEWLGEIPEHWSIKRIKYLAKTIMGQSPNSDDYTFEESDKPFLQGNAEFGALHPKARYFCDTAMKEAPEGALLISVRAPVGALNMADQPYGIGRGLCAVVADQQLLLPSFAWHAMTVTRNELWSIATGSTYEAVSADEVAAVSFTVPPLSEQQAIADFLDRETARIDTLIEKKQRQIELLQEKRSALISHAVTKGLDPNARMKDSGVEWLGEIPEHWEVKRVKNLGTIRYGLGEPPEYVDDGLPFIRATDINRGKVNLDAVRKVRSEDVPWSRRPKLHLGEILVVRSGAYTGDSAIITEDAAGCIAGYDMVLTISKAYAPFVAWALLSKYMLHGQIYLERMRAAQPHLNAEELGGFVILMPPLAEQRRIAETLTSETDKLDALADKIRSSIEMLREHRTALISAVVTGKIDVRGELP